MSAAPLPVLPAPLRVVEIERNKRAKSHDVVLFSREPASLPVAIMRGVRDRGPAGELARTLAAAEGMLAALKLIRSEIEDSIGDDLSLYRVRLHGIADAAIALTRRQS